MKVRIWIEKGIFYAETKSCEGTVGIGATSREAIKDLKREIEKKQKR